MPIQAPQWTEFLSCPICFNIFDEGEHRPISLACGHTVCRVCLSKLTPKKCPFDQNIISRAIEDLPVNFALLQLVGVAVPECQETKCKVGLEENVEFYNSARKCIEELAMYLKPLHKDAPVNQSPVLSRPMQRKLVTLVNCQLVEDEGRCRAVRAARSLGERTVTELILQHQNPQQLSANLWAGVRARGCQFLGPAMQEEVLKLILLALEDGSALSRKVLVLFVVQRLEAQYPQASKTAIGHVVQLLYRASCFKVTKREEESSLMQLKEEFRTYEALRREHDSQIVQIATEAGLRISPEQWSSLLYGDTAHKSHMQSIIDKEETRVDVVAQILACKPPTHGKKMAMLQTPQSFIQSISELTIALQRTGDPGGLAEIKPHLDLLSSIDPGPESISPTWETVHFAMLSIKTVVEGLVDFTNSRTIKKQDLMPLHNPKYKTSMCRDLLQKGKCPRGQSCTFAHSQVEMEKHRQRNKRAAQAMKPMTMLPSNTVFNDTMPSNTVFNDTESMPGDESIECVAIATQATAMKLSQQQRAATISSSVITSMEKFERCSDMSPRSSCSDGEVTVPVVKPCSLPSNMKSKLESSIYSSSDLKPAKDPLKPGVITIPKKVSPGLQQGSQSSSNHQSVQLSSSPANNQQLQSTTTAKVQTIHHFQQQSYLQDSYHPSHHWSFPAFTPQGVGYNQGGAVDERQMITMMPANPYTIDRYGLNARDTVIYNSLVIRSKGKSPSKQLEELQNRKRELLSQLNKTRDPLEQIPLSTLATGSTMVTQARSTMSPSMPHSQSIADSVTEVTPSGSSTRSTVSESHTAVSHSSADSDSQGRSDLNHKFISNGVSLAKSLADSKATSIISMTLANNHDEHDWDCTEQYQGVPFEDAYNTWSSADEEVNMYTSTKELMYPSSIISDDETLPKWTNPQEDWDADVLPSPVIDDNDEFVPLSEESAISKYGPISRMIKTKMKQAAPVQVTAGQPKDTTPVTAVTPLQRPHPITSQVPSRFPLQVPPSNSNNPTTPNPALPSPPMSAQIPPQANNPPPSESPPPTPTEQPEMPQPRHHGDHRADPNGVYVAASLPTALLQPNVIGSSNRSDEPHQLWTLRQRIVDPNQRPKETASNLLGKDKLQSEIAHITNKIQHLQTSEDDRLVRELQAIELNIVEAERQIEYSPDVTSEEVEEAKFTRLRLRKDYFLAACQIPQKKENEQDSNSSTPNTPTAVQAAVHFTQFQSAGAATAVTAQWPNRYNNLHAGSNGAHSNTPSPAGTGKIPNGTGYSNQPSQEQTPPLLRGFGLVQGSQPEAPPGFNRVRFPNPTPGGGIVRNQLTHPPGEGQPRGPFRPHVGQHGTPLGHGGASSHHPSQTSGGVFHQRGGHPAGFSSLSQQFPSPSPNPGGVVQTPPPPQTPTLGHQLQQINQLNQHQSMIPNQSPQQIIAHHQPQGNLAHPIPQHPFNAPSQQPQGNIAHPLPHHPFGAPQQPQGNVAHPIPHHPFGAPAQQQHQAMPHPQQSHHVTPQLPQQPQIHHHLLQQQQQQLPQQQHIAHQLPGQQQHHQISRQQQQNTPTPDNQQHIQIQHPLPNHPHHPTPQLPQQVHNQQYFRHPGAQSPTLQNQLPGGAAMNYMSMSGGGNVVEYHPHQMGQLAHTPVDGGYPRMMISGGRQVVTPTECNGQVSAKDAMDYQLAREAQLFAMSQQRARIVQESEDRKYAEDIAMQEVEKFVRASIADDDEA